MPSFQLQLKHYRLPHDGIIPGARGHKKVVIPCGTKVYCIVYGNLIYWAAYLDEPQAMKCLRALEDCDNPHNKRRIRPSTLLEWNFKDRIPVRIVRPKMEMSS